MKRNYNTEISENSEAVEIIEITDCRYPNMLRELGKDAPVRLYCMGDVSLLNHRSAAVVGARKASSYGRWSAYNAGKKLSAYDVVTVSGMAYGCDSQAHTGALDAGGKTIAVLGCGVDVCYPSGNRALRNRIIKNGLIISEYPSGTAPYRSNFPKRNRIISALCELVIVAEASLASGSLITAGFAAEQGRDVMAFPGNISSPMSIGCNKLIQDGVSPVICMDDIISAMGISLKPEASQEIQELGSDEKIIFKTVKNEGEVTADYIAKVLNKSISEVNAVVAILEIKGLVSTSAGKIYIAK